MAGNARVSVVVIGYRRVPELRETVESLRTITEYPDLELILSDDGSPREQQEQMKALPCDKLLLATRNRGLGANTNAGLAAAAAPFILQIQDDWRCVGPGDFLTRALRLLEARPDIGLVRFTSAGLPEPDEVVSFDEGPPALVFRPVPGSNTFLYSDQPHLKTRRFVDFIGPYSHSRYMQATELDMRDRFNAQERYKVAFLQGYEVFEHIGELVSHRRRSPRERAGRWLRAIPGARPLLLALRRRL